MAILHGLGFSAMDKILEWMDNTENMPFFSTHVAYNQMLISHNVRSSECHRELNITKVLRDKLIVKPGYTN